MSGQGQSADVVVVGLGAVGSAVACALARRGVRVVGFDRFHPPHDQGSSHGLTRITRLAVGEGADYVPLVQRSHALWRQLESESGLTLMRQTGVIVIASPAADAGIFHGQPGFFERTCTLARRFGIAHEILSPADVRARFPAFALGEAESAYHEPEGGVLFPESCIRAQWQVARAHGAELRPGETLTGLSSTASGVTLHTDRATLQAAKVLLCTGAWLPQQAGGPVQARLRVLRQVLHWFEAERPEWFAADRCPAHIWLHGPRMEDSFYGFPMIDGQPGVKLATEQLQDTVDPDAVPRDVDEALARTMFDRHLDGRLRGLRPRSVAHATCLYTMAGDGRFVVDRHPRHEHVSVVSACSGHGFKHSAGLGEALALQLTGREEHPSLAAFRLGTSN